jgi:DNA topoisomerase-1
MVDARVLRTTLEISAKGPGGETVVFTASGKAIEFAGFRRAYVEGSDDPAAELEEQEAILPACRVGDRIHRDGTTPITLVRTEPKRHETLPPARFTEASLIKELERLGIGRPSTYAPTIATIVRRGYVFRQGKALVPSFTAFAVTKLLREHFGDFVETDFTAEMEDDLDEISRGEREWVAFLRQFYYGDRKHRGLLPAVEHGAEKADYPVLELGADPQSGETVRVRIGRFGPFLQVGEGGPGRTASLPEEVAPADLSVDRAMELVRAKAEGPRTLGVDPATGQNVYVMNGRYGAYVQLGETPEKVQRSRGKAQSVAEKPKRASLQSGMTESTVTLEEALRLLSLPRVVGLHPDDARVAARAQAVATPALRAEEGAARAGRGWVGPQGPGGSLWPVCHRRHHQCLDPEDDEPRGVDLCAGGRTAGRTQGRGADGSPRSIPRPCRQGVRGERSASTKGRRGVTLTQGTMPKAQRGVALSIGH